LYADLQNLFLKFWNYFRQKKASAPEPYCPQEIIKSEPEFSHEKTPSYKRETSRPQVPHTFISGSVYTVQIK
jgi:hypothetical protein